MERRHGLFGTKIIIVDHARKVDDSERFISKFGEFVVWELGLTECFDYFRYKRHFMDTKFLVII